MFGVSIDNGAGNVDDNDNNNVTLQDQCGHQSQDQLITQKMHLVYTGQGGDTFKGMSLGVWSEFCVYLPLPELPQHTCVCVCVCV